MPHFKSLVRLVLRVAFFVNVYVRVRGLQARKNSAVTANVAGKVSLASIAVLDLDLVRAATLIPVHHVPNFEGILSIFLHKRFHSRCVSLVKANDFHEAFALNIKD